MKNIQGYPKCLREVLEGQRFSIDYYQREYRWGKKQVIDLIEDLCGKFLDCYDPDSNIGEVESSYDRYFLGSIIISYHQGKHYIVDGQQRLTTLTLLLIYLKHQLKESNKEISHLRGLISTYRPPKESFVLDVDEREQCMQALFKDNNIIDISTETESVTKSVQNIVSRYQDIVDNFPNEIVNHSADYFAAWLIYNVDLIMIKASSDSDAYTIFETMNDRGLSLTSTDMLKGYLLTNITEQESRNTANEIWRERINELRNIGKEEDSDAIKGWLRSQYATTVRERKRDSQDQDFELIASQSHRWVRDNANELGLSDKNSQTYFDFISSDFEFYTKWYMFLINKTKDFSSKFPNVYYNAQNNFSLQYPVILAPLNQNDSEDMIFKKIRLTSVYLDIVLARRIWNNRAIDYATMKHNMYKSIILQIRNMSYSELIKFFTNELNREDEQFSANQSLQLNRQNRRKIHRILARITDFVEQSTGGGSRYCEYTEREQNPYEIEHIWANKYIEHGHDVYFDNEYEFFDYRNRIGGLLLLPKRSNASYSDLPYNEKIEHYQKNELLASSLHHSTYSNNPAFNDFIASTRLNFEAYSEFGKSELDQRQYLYLRIAEKIWSPDNLKSD